MPATFNLELVPGQLIALETTVSSADDVDMARMEDGTIVDGMFWGKLNIVHSGDTHTVDFNGTKMKDPDITPDFLFDSRVMTKLTTAARPTTAKCHLSILAPAQQYCDVILTVNPLWSLTLTWPPAENVGEHKHKYFLRVHPGGALEHFESEMVVTSLYYEAVSVIVQTVCSIDTDIFLLTDLTRPWLIPTNSSHRGMASPCLSATSYLT